MDEKHSSKWQRLSTFAIAVALFGMLLTAFIQAVMDGSSLNASLLGVFGALIAMFLILSSGSALEEISFGPFGAKWRKIEEIDSKVEALQIAVGSLLTWPERAHLRKLANNTSDQVQFRRSMLGELERVHALGYLKPARDGALEEMARRGHLESLHLREMVEITEKGEKFLKTYDEWFPPNLTVGPREEKEGSAGRQVAIRGGGAKLAHSVGEVKEIARQAKLGDIDPYDPEIVRWEDGGPDVW